MPAMPATAGNASSSRVCPVAVDRAEHDTYDRASHEKASDDAIVFSCRAMGAAVDAGSGGSRPEITVWRRHGGMV